MVDGNDECITELLSRTFLYCDYRSSTVDQSVIQQTNMRSRSFIVGLPVCLPDDTGAVAAV